MKIDRRNFLRNTTLASTSLMVPNFLRSFNGPQLLNSRSGKVLVVVQFSGGNDGLNSIVPFENDIYYRNRPTLAIPKREVIKLEKGLGLNPALKELKTLFDEGQLSVVNNVGYPNPDRSHFRSMDIWQTASESNEYLSTGWLGRYLDSNCIGCDVAHHALEMDDNLSLAMKGLDKIGFAVSNPEQLKRVTSNPFLKSISQYHDHVHEENAAYLYKTLIDTQSSANYLYEKSKTHRSTVSYPFSPLAKKLKKVAELMTADSDTKIYYVNHGGFDTHVNQKNTQARLLEQYATAMTAFVKDLKQNKLFDETLIMTFSEFGRRVKQNASNGTDHGTANNIYLIGGKLRKAGIYNSAPNLSNLDNGDLIYEVDFREIYANILEGWLDANPRQILGQNFDSLNLV